MGNTPYQRGMNRVYGAANIKRVIQQQKPNHSTGGETSIADKPHANSREVQRRLRQEARRICRKCELPKEICACAEAAAYDRANAFRP